MKLRRRVLVSLAAGTAVLVSVWLLYWFTDHGYVHIWQGSQLHIIAAFGWMWPYFAIHPFKIFVDHPSLGWLVIFTLDLIAYTGVAFLVSFAYSQRKRKAYFEE